MSGSASQNIGVLAVDFAPVLAKMGRPRLVEGRSVNVSVSISSDLDAKLTQLSKAMDTPRASVIRAAIVGLVDQAELEGVLDPPPVETPPAATSKPKKKAPAR